METQSETKKKYSEALYMFMMLLNKQLYHQEVKKGMFPQRGWWVTSRALYKGNSVMETQSETKKKYSEALYMFMMLLNKQLYHQEVKKGMFPQRGWCQFS